MSTHLNLMPMSYRRRHLIVRRVRQWCAMWVLAIVLLSLLAWTQWSQYQSGVAHLDSRQREYAPIKKLAQEVKAIEGRIEDLRRREALSLELADERSMLSLVGVLSAAAESSGGQVAINTLRFERRGQGAEHANIVTLQGVAVDDFSVARFSARLRDAKAFSKVELKSTGDVSVGETEARSYSLECSF